MTKFINLAKEPKENMELNEVKKSLYKEKPVAKLVKTLKKSFVFEAILQNGNKIKFSIPFNDVWEDLGNEIEAHLLIRWIVN